MNAREESPNRKVKVKPVRITPKENSRLKSVDIDDSLDALFGGKTEQFPGTWTER